LPSAEELESEVFRIIEACKKRGVTLRLFGALAFRIHCPKYHFLHSKLGREYTDLDFMGYGRQREAILKIFVDDLDYMQDSRFSGVMMYRFRQIFHSKTSNIKAEVFFDRLEMCHTIYFDKNKRLEVDYPTISLADLLLEKIQIVDITRKDLIDATMLLLEHDVGNSDNEKINVEYIAKLLSNDWGFYYTATRNLRKIKDFAVLPEYKETVTQKVEKILDFIERAPKSLTWQMRAKVGPRMKWYNDVSWQ
jgi:hypothetical protein